MSYDTNIGGLVRRLCGGPEGWPESFGEGEIVARIKI